MLSFEKESHLFDPVAAYKRRKSFSLQEKELPFFEYRIDLFGFSKKLQLTVAVELKLHRWRRAVEQSLVYQLCADLVFIALPAPSIKPVDIPELERYGIGLISVFESAHCRQVVAARESSVVRPHYRDQYIQMLQRVA